ncbi:unnamed protein product, partial [Prorocentrum cordatum]
IDLILASSDQVSCRRAAPRARSPGVRCPGWPASRGPATLKRRLAAPSWRSLRGPACFGLLKASFEPRWSRCGPPRRRRPRLRPTLPSLRAALGGADGGVGRTEGAMEGEVETAAVGAGLEQAASAPSVLARAGGGSQDLGRAAPSSPLAGDSWADELPVRRTGVATSSGGAGAGGVRAGLVLAPPPTAAAAAADDDEGMDALERPRTAEAPAQRARPPPQPSAAAAAHAPLAGGMGVRIRTGPRAGIEGKVVLLEALSGRVSPLALLDGTNVYWTHEPDDLEPLDPLG